MKIHSQLLASMLLVTNMNITMLHAAEPLAVPASPAPTTLQDETAYFSFVNETGGYITKSMHDAFWMILQAKYDEHQRAKIVADVHNALDIIRDFQYQTWESAKTSYFAKMAQKSNEYERLKAQLEKQNSPYFTPQAVIENAEKIIEAAANRFPLDLGAGKFYITPELIQENMVGIKGSYERLKLLLTPEWKDEYKEYILPKEMVSLLSLYSPDEYHETITHTNEKIDIHIAQLSTDKSSLYEIGAVDYQKGDKKFANFLPEEKEIYIQEFVKEQFSGYKVSEPMLSRGMWRGYSFAKGVASLGDLNVIVMSFFVDDKALYFKFVSDKNLSLASADFNDFTKRIQILERNSTNSPFEPPIH
ncbi:MAG TPA: hypothetical protein PLD88_00790 [Candidatus Berkiella sp.]|nr:hypothetical protein [Candidatus Berkiella sp.]